MGIVLPLIQIYTSYNKDNTNMFIFIRRAILGVGQFLSFLLQSLLGFLTLF